MPRCCLDLPGVLRAWHQDGRDREEATKMFFYMATKMLLFTRATDSLQPHPRAKNYLFFPNLSSFAAWFFIILVKHELPCYIPRQTNIIHFYGSTNMSSSLFRY